MRDLGNRVIAWGVAGAVALLALVGGWALLVGGLMVLAVLGQGGALAVNCVLIGVLGGVLLCWARPWWCRLGVVLTAALASEMQVVWIREAANRDAVRLAEVGLREYPVGDGGANTFAVLLGWVPGVWLALLVWGVLWLVLKGRKGLASKNAGI